MKSCRDCNIRIPDPADTEACSDSCPTTHWPQHPWPPTPTPPTPTPYYDECLHKTCLINWPTHGVPDPFSNRCTHTQNRAPQPAQQTTLNPKSGATDYEKLLHMSILFYEAQVGFKFLC